MTDKNEYPIPLPEHFDFGTALNQIKLGAKVCREGWNGKGVFIFMADSIDFHTYADLSHYDKLYGQLTIPSVVMKTANDQFCVGWLASQADMLADDWMLAE